MSVVDCALTMGHLGEGWHPWSFLQLFTIQRSTV